MTGLFATDVAAPGVAFPYACTHRRLPWRFAPDLCATTLVQVELTSADRDLDTFVTLRADNAAQRSGDIDSTGLLRNAAQRLDA